MTPEPSLWCVFSTWTLFYQMITHFPYQQISLIRALGALDTLDLVNDKIEELRQHVSYFKILIYSRLIPIDRIKPSGDCGSLRRHSVTVSSKKPSTPGKIKKSENTTKRRGREC